MLAELSVKNYALIDDLRIEFGPGLSVLTGETGAGKSIILGALSLVLGERFDSSMLRTGADECRIEARFEDVGALKPACDEAGVDCSDGVLILRRRADRNGRNTVHANDSNITVAALRRLGDRLVDLHGQHQHQLLLQPEVHLDILDLYGQLSAERGQFAEEHGRLLAERGELLGIEQDLAERRQRKDLTEYQLKELGEAAVEPGEMARLRQEQELGASAERRYALARELESVLSEQEGSLVELMAIAGKRLDELARADERLTPGRDALAEAQARVEELWRETVSYRDGIQFSPERAEEVNSRLFLIEKLTAKYRVQPDELAALEAGLRKESDSLELDQSRCEKLRASIASLEKRLITAAHALSRKRLRAKEKLESRLGSEFSALGLGRAVLEVALEHPPSPGADSLTANGFDRVEFLFTANPGEDKRPLRKVASGGELSRIMLGLKNALAGVKLVPSMVFDEIDSGIGGRIAESVGRRLASIGRTQQVICITHLPQIAKYADDHFVVTKATRQGRTVSAIRRLAKPERIQELARMASGADITDTGLALAKEMLEAAGAGK